MPSPKEQEPRAGATARCPGCGLRVATATTGGPVANHENSFGEPCFGSSLWPSAAPAATFVGWGVGLFLGALLPLFIGFDQLFSASGFGGSNGTGWFILSGLMQLAGVVMLCMGTYRLARKADVAFVMALRRHTQISDETDTA